MDSDGDGTPDHLDNDDDNDGIPDDQGKQFVSFVIHALQFSVLQSELLDLVTPTPFLSSLTDLDDDGDGIPDDEDSKSEISAFC